MKKLTGILLIIFAIFVGVFVGVWWMLIEPIKSIYEAYNISNIDEGIIIVSIIKILGLPILGFEVFFIFMSGKIIAKDE